MAWNVRYYQDIQYLTIPQFDNTGLVIHGITTRSCGNMSPRIPEAYYRHIASKVFQTETLFICRQIHSNNIYEPDETTCLPEGDGLITNKKGIGIAVFTADCLPIFILDIENIAIGIVHAGWRGTLHRIVQHALQKMQEKYYTKFENCIIGIGPGICGKCYEIKEELGEYIISKFTKYNKYNMFLKKKKNNKYVLDLAEMNRQQLLEIGVMQENIFICKYCTSEDNNMFFSYRKEGESAGRMMSILRLI
jgi:hypothetical protein